jgi:hypothetical protein
MIGSRNISTPAVFFPGTIDDVRFYNYARSLSQVGEDMNNTSITGNSPIGWWKMEGATLSQSNLWVKDILGSGLYLLSDQSSQANQPTNFIRRKDAVGLLNGYGSDGSITFNSNTNLSTFNHPGRSCSNGGDMATYNVTALTSNTATLTPTPGTGCFAVGDYVMLINQQGTTSNMVNVGNYERLRITDVNGAVLTFGTNKTKFYGNGASDDTNLGTAATNQRVAAIRLPQYGNVTISTGVTLNANAWDGTKGGVLAFTASGTVTVTGSINVNALGYRGGAAIGTATVGNGGESFCGLGGVGAGASGAAGAGNGATGGTGSCGGGGGSQTSAGIGSTTKGGSGGGGSASRGAGGGAGYGTAATGGGINGLSGGTNASGNGGVSNPQGGGGGGGTYSDTTISKLMLGSGGGSGGNSATDTTSGSGGTGGGAVYIAANTITVTGSIVSTGSNAGTPFRGPSGNGDTGGGGGASGGSVKLETVNATLGSSLITALGGSATSASTTGGTGGSGRIAIYSKFITGTTNPTYIGL